jgi:hypothetical protein
VRSGETSNIEHPTPNIHREMLRIGAITITRVARGKLWLANAAGEGMATSEKKFGRWVAEYFKREF